MAKFIRAMIRPAVTLMFSGALCYGFLVNIVSVDAFLGVAVAVITYWFKSRDEEEKIDDRRKY